MRPRVDALRGGGPALLAPLAPLDRLSAGVLAVSGATLLVNLLCFRRPRGGVAERVPFVSVLVPARNEARAIERCVRSLLAQDYPSFELLVLDDHSEDGTGDILRKFLAERPPVPFRVLQGEALPSGWVGKNWACQQLARAASAEGDFLLFTDADTVHAPEALGRAVGEAARDGLALLSLMPTQEVQGWAEVLAVPLLPLQILGYLPLPALERVPVPAFAAANGQYMLFQRGAYWQGGGHAARPAQLAEDVTLARQVKAHGGRVRLANGAGLVRCRMYHDAGEVVAGFRRSFASGFRIDGRVAGAITLANAGGYLLPFLRLSRSHPARWMAVGVLALRLLLAWRTETPMVGAIMHPFGMALLLWAQLLAAYDAVAGKQATWKGRHYGLEGQEGARDGAG